MTDAAGRWLAMRNGTRLAIDCRTGASAASDVQWPNLPNLLSMHLVLVYGNGRGHFYHLARYLHVFVYTMKTSYPPSHVCVCVLVCLCVCVCGEKLARERNICDMLVIT